MLYVAPPPPPPTSLSEDAAAAADACQQNVLSPGVQFLSW